MKFVTGNSNKFEEARRVIPNLQMVKRDLDEIQAVDQELIIKHKLMQAATSESGILFVEDVALTFPSLGKLPGPLIKWFLHEMKLDELSRLGREFCDGRALARCTLGLWKDGSCHYFTSEIDGNICAPRGTHGFGWDAIFIPTQSKKSFAEMEPAEKQRYSMRTRVFEDALKFINSSF